MNYQSFPVSTIFYIDISSENASYLIVIKRTMKVEEIKGSLLQKSLLLHCLHQQLYGNPPMVSLWINNAIKVSKQAKNIQEINSKGKNYKFYKKIKKNHKIMSPSQSLIFPLHLKNNPLFISPNILTIIKVLQQSHAYVSSCLANCFY